MKPQETYITVELIRFGSERYISRSQAKRILRGLDQFNRIAFDFKDVKKVGQGFVDEIFRVYQNMRPEVELSYTNAIDDIEFMIKRGIKK